VLNELPELRKSKIETLDPSTLAEYNDPADPMRSTFRSDKVLANVK
jgi:hypothetical protein